MGRGLLLRSYEIPGTIVEDLGFRTRYGFYRDIEGIKGGYSDKFFEIYLFQGRPLNNLVPPNLNENNLKRPHLLEGIEGRFYLSDWQIGTTYLRDNIEDKVHEYGALSVGTILLFDLQIYGEYTRKTGGDNGLFDLSDETAHALYASINGQFDAIGVIFEYKDYNDFQLGYNDPPSLVKEHQYLLLNRNTHSVAAINETGWQSEFYYAFEGGHLLNINLSEAVNTLFDKRYIFQEQFAEFSFNLNPSSTIKGYIDRNMEDLLAIKDRYTAGVYYESAFSELWGTTIDFAYQTLNYTQGDKDRYYTIRR